jgi:magnesium-transporting ATPase (P-type)
MKTEKISSLVLYVVFAVIILLFGVFFTYGYDNQYVANPKFNDPAMLDGVMILMYSMAAITALLIVWSLLKSFLQNMGGPKGENLSGVPGGTITAVSVVILIVSLLVGFCVPSETIVANGDVVTDQTAIMLADCFICSIYVLSIVALVAMFFNMTGFMKRK